MVLRRARIAYYSLMCPRSPPPYCQQDPSLAASRAAADDALSAALLRGGGLQPFLRHWYAMPMWASLTSHPHFGALLEKRAEDKQDPLLGSKAPPAEGRRCRELAAVLSAGSPGRMVRLSGPLCLFSRARGGICFRRTDSTFHL